MEPNHNHLQQLLTQLDALKEKVDGIRPLTETQQRQLDQKLRLDWNYHSNSIEGNTLSASETRAFILHGITAKGKPFRDYIEMKGHDDALKKLDSIVKKDTKITESLIKELHKIILVDPYTDEAAEINPGHYKTVPNYLYTATGERLDFLPPEEVATEMNKLINWLNNHIEPPKRRRNKYDLHPILIATAFHVRFIQIHPFGDGNGRMARILGNLVLMLCGYTPAIIKLEKRQEYYAMLNLSTLSAPQPLAEMIAEETIRTLQMTLDVSKGIPIDEQDDIHKELSLLEKEIEGIGRNENIVKRTDGAISKILHEIFVPMMFEMDRHWARIRDYFESTKAIIITDSSHKKYEWLPDGAENYITGIKLGELKKIDFTIELNELKIALPKNKSYKYGFAIEFSDYECKLLFNHYGKETITIYYGDEIDRKEYEDLAKSKMKYFIEYLREDIKKIKRA